MNDCTTKHTDAVEEPTKITYDNPRRVIEDYHAGRTEGLSWSIREYVRRSIFAREARGQTYYETPRRIASLFGVDAKTVRGVMRHCTCIERTTTEHGGRVWRWKSTRSNTDQKVQVLKSNTQTPPLSEKASFQHQKRRNDTTESVVSTPKGVVSARPTKEYSDIKEEKNSIRIPTDTIFCVQEGRKEGEVAAPASQPDATPNGQNTVSPNGQPSHTLNRSTQPPIPPVAPAPLSPTPPQEAREARQWSPYLKNPKPSSAILTRWVNNCYPDSNASPLITEAQDKMMGQLEQSMLFDWHRQIDTTRLRALVPDWLAEVVKQHGTEALHSDVVMGCSQFLRAILPRVWEWRLEQCARVGRQFPEQPRDMVLMMGGK